MNQNSNFSKLDFSFENPMIYNFQIVKIKLYFLLIFHFHKL
jgi:hypothetical protein